MLQNAFVDVYLFPISKKGEREATFHEGREENLHHGKTLVIFMCLDVFCPRLWVLIKRVVNGEISPLKDCKDYKYDVSRVSPSL